VVAHLTEEFEKQNRRVCVTATGFRSLVSGKNEDFRLLIHSERLYKSLSFVPGVVYAPSLLLRRGASFRTERFPEFAKLELQQAAATVVAERKVGRVSFSPLSSLFPSLSNRQQEASPTSYLF
jgi:hypothetical protein